MFDRALEDWTQQGVVARDNRCMALLPADCIGHAADHRDIDQAIRWIGGRFQKK